MTASDDRGLRSATDDRATDPAVEQELPDAGSVEVEEQADAAELVDDIASETEAPGR